MIYYTTIDLILITCCVKFLSKSHVLATLLDDDCHDEVLLEGHRGQPLLGAFPALVEPPVRPGGGPRDLPLDPKTPPQRSFPGLLSVQLFLGPFTFPRGL